MFRLFISSVFYSKMANGVMVRMLRLQCLLSGENKRWSVTDSTTVEGGKLARTWLTLTSLTNF